MQLATPDLLQQTAPELVQTLVRTLLDGPPGELDVPGDLDAGTSDLDVLGKLNTGTRDLKTRTLSVGQMHALYERGATLGEVGAQAGISAERVSQLFKKAELPTRSKAQIDELKRQAIALRAHERRDVIVESFRDTRNVAAVAKEHELSKLAVREILEAEIPFHEYRALRRTSAPKQYSDQELLGFLREAGAAREGLLTIAFYKAFAHGRHTADGRSWPTHQTHSKRFGSWRNALHAAGMQANEQRAGRDVVFAADRCLQAINAVHQQLGKTPTAQQYARHARDSAGSLPSLSTIRNRYDSWLAALHAARV
jgi:Homing endonuclease associated repeat/Sigma-70, region 4